MTLKNRSKRPAFLITLLFVVVAGSRILANTLILPPSIAAFLSSEQNGVMDDGEIVRGANGSDEFVRYVCAHWRDIVANCGSIAPDKRRQNLIAAAAEALPPTDYVDFLNSVCDSITSGKTPSFDIYAITDGVREKEGFLAYNYDDPRVAEVIRKLEAICIAKRPNDPNEKNLWTAEKSGKAKQNVIEYMKENGRRMPQELAGANPQIPSATPTTTKVTPSQTSALAATAQDHESDRIAATKATVWPWVIGVLALAGVALLITKLRR